MSREEIEKLSENAFSIDTAIISITDYWDDGYFDTVDFKCRPLTYRLLELSFNDIDGDVFVDELGDNPSDEEILKIEEKYHMFSNKQAAQIANFVIESRGKINTIICQCEHGQSRSAAVAAAIKQFKSHNGINIFADDKYYPNKLVYRKTLSALNNHRCSTACSYYNDEKICPICIQQVIEKACPSLTPDEVGIAKCIYGVYYGAKHSDEEVSSIFNYPIEGVSLIRRMVNFQVRNMPISDLTTNSRLRNLMRYNHVETISELLERDVDTVVRFKHMGRNHFEMLLWFLDIFDLNLKEKKI